MQALNGVMQPAYQAQVELERWCRGDGIKRALANGWEKGAKNFFMQRIVTDYVEAVESTWRAGRRRPTQFGAILGTIGDVSVVRKIAVEAACFLSSLTMPSSNYKAACGAIGKRAEYVIWLNHPAWKDSYHRRSLGMLMNGDLGCDQVMKRLKAKGMWFSGLYEPMTIPERIILGNFYLEMFLQTSGLLECYMECDHSGRRAKRIGFTKAYYEFQDRWKQAVTTNRPTYMPMLTLPRPWIDKCTGGYYTIHTELTPIDYTVSDKYVKEDSLVLQVANLLQSTPMQIDSRQVELIRAAWDLNHPIDSLPNRIGEEVKSAAEYRRMGIYGQDKWRMIYRAKAEERKIAARTKTWNSFKIHEILKDKEQLFFPAHFDYRWRFYYRGSHFNPQGPNHTRSALLLARRSPVKGHEREFAWSLGEGIGLAPDGDVRLDYLRRNSEVIRRVGLDPLDTMAVWTGVKDPWKVVQLARDWAGYLADPGYTSGTIHWRDQTCSGWGHVSCLLLDGDLARITNVTGDRRRDLYSGVGQLVTQRAQWLIDNGQAEGRKEEALRWLLDHPPARAFWKEAVMPMIYGRTYMTLHDTVHVYLDRIANDLYLSGTLRVREAAQVIAQVVHHTVNEICPHIAELSHWLRDVARAYTKQGIRPYWVLPSGAQVESYSEDQERISIEYTLRRGRVKLQMRCNNGKLSLRGCGKRMVPDYVQSQDAAFLHQFVRHWYEVHGRPLVTVHDCFGTTLDGVGMMRRELCDQWARFYSEDPLKQLQVQVLLDTGVRLPNPDYRFTLDREKIGENQHLFS